MKTWELAVTLDSSSGLPIFLQIARSIVDDVRRGRLRPGDPLPGSRTLAGWLGVNRNTVVAGYRELEAEGWIQTRAAGATFVSPSLPEVGARRFAAEREGVPSRVGFAVDQMPRAAEAGPLMPPPMPRGMLALYGGLPDVRLVPVAALARAYRRAVTRNGGAGRERLLGYGDPRGHAGLRAALAGMVSATRGVAATEETVMVTRGSQQAIDLIGRVLIAPGDVVAVEAYGYRPAWEALKRAGAVLEPVAVDEQGLEVDELARVCARRTVRAVYVTPHHQYPTTVTMSASRRLALLELARERRMAVIEDDYDHEFHYEGRPVLPLASADRAGVVVYVGTMSKILAPGLRIGFVVAPPPLVERLAEARRHVDRQGDLAVEQAVAELLEEGEVARHARRARRVYERRRGLMVESLRREIGAALDFEVPAGGMAIWARVAEGIDADAWMERGMERGVAVQAGRQFAFDGRARPYLRLGFAGLDEKELKEAVRRLRRAI